MISIDKTKIRKNNKKGFTPPTFAKKVGGFSLVEIILVVFVMVVISSVVIFKYNDFSDSIELENIALDVILSVREAQIFGISSRGTTTPESFFYSYGVQFDDTEDGSFISFVDSVGNNLWYDPPGEQLSKTIFREGYKINTLCISNPGEICNQAELNILFQRPNVNAIIKTGEFFIGSANSARIELISPSGVTVSVNVFESGQVYMD